MQHSSDPLASIIVLGRRTVVVDVGANPIDGDPPYKSMLSRGLCDLFGFEAHPEAFAKLEAKKGPHETYSPDAVGDGGSHTLHICHAPGMTSLLEPDPAALQLFPDFPRWGTVKRTTPVSTCRLDDIAAIAHMDFLKTDAQGAELSIFRGARTRLSKAVAVQTEVSFIPFYKKQPTFADIDVELRGMGFVPHMFAALNRRMLHPLRGKTAFEHLNQVVEADIVYVRDFRAMERMSVDQLGHLAMLAHHVFRSFDLAARCLMELAHRKAIRREAMDIYVGAIRSGG